MDNSIDKKNPTKTDKPKRSEAAKKPEAAKKAVKKASEEPRLAWWYQFRQYLREVSFELRKVVWPSRKETIGSTIVVLVIVLLSGVYLGMVDMILSRLVRLLVG